MDGKKKFWKMICRTFFLLGTALLLLTGCGKQIQQQESTDPETDKMQIGLSFDSFVIERWTRDRDMFVSTAQSLGAEVNVQVANGDVQEQISQIEYFIEKNMDVIAIIAIDGEALSEVVKQAKEKGIRVICYDRLIPNAGADLYISFDNRRVGELMGEELVKACPQGGNIFMINGSPTDHNVAQVSEGFADAIEGSDLQVVYTDYCENWLAELAFEKVNEGLAKTTDIVGVMCGNDDLASQAVRALAENRLAGKVTVVAQDAELAGCQRIVEGTQRMTVYKPVEELAKQAATLAVALGNGQKIYQIEKSDQEGSGEPTAMVNTETAFTVMETIFDGTYDIPYYSIKPVAVTAENLEEVIIDSGFHRAEDVYLNIK